MGTTNSAITTPTTTTTVIAVGVDVDRDALLSARTNSINNGLEMQLFLHEDGPVEAATATNINTMSMSGDSNDDTFAPAATALRNHTFDIVVANILAPILIDLAPQLARYTAPGTGHIALSGILDFQAAAVMQVYAEYFDDLKVEHTEGEWVLVTGRRKCWS